MKASIRSLLPLLLTLVLTGAGCANRAVTRTPVNLGQPAELGATETEGLRLTLRLSPARELALFSDGEWRTVSTGEAGGSPRFLQWSARIQDATSGQPIPAGNASLRLHNSRGDLITVQPMYASLGSDGEQYTVFSDGMPDGTYSAELTLAPATIGRDVDTRAKWTDPVTATFRFTLQGESATADQSLPVLSVSANRAVTDATSLGVRESAGWQIAADLDSHSGFFFNHDGSGYRVDSLQSGETWLRVRIQRFLVDISGLSVAASQGGNRVDLQPVWSARGIEYVARMAAAATPIEVSVTPPSYPLLGSAADSQPPSVTASFPLPQPTAPAPPVRRQSAQGRFSVVLGVFGSRANVERIVARLEASNLSAFVNSFERRGNALHQVVSGPVQTISEADQLKATVDRMFQVNSKVVRDCHAGDKPCS